MLTYGDSRMKRLALVLPALLAFGLAVTPAYAGDDKADEKPAAAEKAPEKGAEKPAEKAAEKPAEKPAEHAEKKNGDEEDEAPAKHDLVTYTIDVSVQSLAKFDLGQGTVSAEFLLEVNCDKEPCNPHLELTNGKFSGKPDVLSRDPLHKQMRVKANLEADIDLSAFPYDMHTLRIDLVEGKDAKQVKLKVGEGSIGEKVKLAGWEFDKEPGMGVEQIDAGDKDKQDEFSFTIGIHRPKLQQSFKSLVPVLFMLLVAATGLFLRPKSIGPRFAASTGGIVPLVMFHVGQIASLPAVGYLTRLDKIMIASYLAFVAHITFNVLILRSEEVKTEERSMKLHKTAAFVVPAVAIALWLIAMFS